MSLTSGSPVRQVSVVIPTYNRAVHVVEAIESVLAQSNVSVELIVVDDGSSDDTAQAVARFSDRVKYIYQENSGVGVARNTGLRAAKHPWVALLDSDDIWLPGKLERQFRELEEFPNAIAHMPNVWMDRQDVASGNLVDIRGMRDMFDGEKPIFIERPLVFNIRHNFARNQGVLARKDSVIACGMYTERRGHTFDDTDLFNRLALQGSWVVSPVANVREIRREEETEAVGAGRVNKPHTGYLDLLEIFQILRHSQGLSGAENQAIAKAIALYSGMLATTYMRMGDNLAARKALWSGIKSRPSLRLIVKLGLTYVPSRILQKALK